VAIFVLTDRNKHVVLTDPVDQVPKVYARTPQTAAFPHWGKLSAQVLAPLSSLSLTSRLDELMPLNFARTLCPTFAIEDEVHGSLFCNRAYL
jgi:hypothetical protein